MSGSLALRAASWGTRHRRPAVLQCEALKLYVCYGTFKAAPRPGGHPCGVAHDALRKAGYEPEVIRSYGLGCCRIS